jgi:hypothetical protein
VFSINDHESTITNESPIKDPENQQSIACRRERVASKIAMAPRAHLRAAAPLV